MIEAVKNAMIAGSIIWAIVFGINIAGKHYGLDFSTNGVSLVWGK